jgi:hypothetical protein
MTYPRPLVVALFASLVAASCGGAARTTGGVTPPPDNQEPDAGSDNTPPPKMDAAPPTGADIGEKCTTRTQCQSGICVDGVCCNEACTGTCRSCNVTGSVGTCTNVPDNEDPRDQCKPDPASPCKRDGMCDGEGACRKTAVGTECAPATCTGSIEFSNRTCDGNGACAAATMKTCAGGCMAGVCPAPCGPNNPCQTGLFCDATSVCRPKKTMGLPCMTGDECSLGFCVDGVCCGSACTGTCQACNLPGAVGNCTPVPSGQDPNTECLKENSLCGRIGGCDGAGACALATLGTPCGTNGGMACTGTTETQRACDGRGMCQSMNPRSCAPYRCQGTACGVVCFSNADCAPGNTCQGGACQGGGDVTGGELLHWAFDEASNTATLAEDTSGNFHQGEYLGNAGNRPAVSNNVPPIGVTNPHSRTFDNAQREAVRLAAFPQDLRPANELTLSAWFRATTVDTNGADIISGGDSYLLRIRTGSIEFGKRTTNAAGTSVFASCRVNHTGHLNNQWHHIAGVTTTAGMVLYLDGVEICSNTNGGDIVYDRGNDLFVGRHGFNETTWDFEGSIDDVRIFGRELTADEIRGIAGANPGAADIVLQWRFDEASTTTTTANDDSGNNYDGTYIGNGSLPRRNADVAPISGVTNPWSREFNRTNREAVQRTNMPAALKPVNDLSLSVWYKANSTDTSGSELISAGDNYSLRLRPGLIEFSKRINDGTAHWVQCDGPVNNHLNNAWHHVAAVTSIDGMVVYFDGVEICNSAEGGNIVYDQGNTFFVGRHGNAAQQNWDFQGLIDDVRVYGRALDATEVQDLFGGTRPAEVVLQWKMDETSTTTTTALDSSGANLNGTYIGTTGHPAPSPDVPGALGSADPESRLFTRANRHAVRLLNMPASLKLTNELSVSAWYKASTLGLGTQTGEEIVSAGNSYLLRVRNNQMEFSKRTATGFAQCIGPFTGTLDGTWHHVVGVTTATGMLLYVDGAQVMTNARNDAIVYDTNADFVVGRHPLQTTWDFDGNIDDVRVYSRALTDADVLAIFQGQQ